MKVVTPERMIELSESQQMLWHFHKHLVEYVLLTEGTAVVSILQLNIYKVLNKF